MSAGNVLAKIEESKLAHIGKRQVSMVGWSLGTVTDHLLTHLVEPDPIDRWCDVDCMARTMFQRKTDGNIKRVRQRIRGLFRALLEQGRFMAIRYDDAPSGRGRILACKILTEEHNEADVIAANRQIERMYERKELSDVALTRAHDIVCRAMGIHRQE
jgi:hypothetical protein